MNKCELLYCESFVKTCQDQGIDTEALLKRVLEIRDIQRAAAQRQASKPNYELRRQLANVLTGIVGGGLMGAGVGMKAETGDKRVSALTGAAAGAGLGAAGGLLTNLIRKYLGFAAMGTPVTQAREQ